MKQKVIWISPKIVLTARKQRGLIFLAAGGFLSQTGSYGREQLVIGKRQFEHEAMALGNPREEIIHFDRDDSWDREVNEFLAAVKERRPSTHGTLEEARQVMELIRDIYAMAEANQRREGAAHVVD